MLVVLDHVLDEDRREAVANYFSSFVRSGLHGWVDIRKSEIDNDPSPVSRLLSIAARYVDLASMVGCEYWHHRNSAPHWHVDVDEKLQSSTGVVRTPLCSIVYYPQVENLYGGAFYTADAKVLPKTNRMIIFGSGIEHGVEAFTGSRLSVAMNPWPYKLKEHL